MPSASPESYTGTMCGWCMRAAVSTSSSNRPGPTAAARSGRRTLIATWRWCFRSSARYTVAMPPAPISCCSRYLPASTAVSRSIVESTMPPVPTVAVGRIYHAGSAVPTRARTAASLLAFGQTPQVHPMAVATQELELFVRDALSRGQSRESIADALDAYAPVDFPVPVPRPRPYLSAREAFLYLVLFATLYIAAWHLGSLLFDLINRAFPDPADTAHEVTSYARSIRWSTASVIIAFPVFLFVARHLSRELARSPIKRLSGVRRWLTYLTLFIAAAVLIGDMITLVNNV